MFRLYGYKKGGPRKLMATFDTEAQLRAYVTWATLRANIDGSRAFEQGSSLAGYDRFDYSDERLTEEDDTQVDHNPTPSML